MNDRLSVALNKNQLSIQHTLLTTVEILLTLTKLAEPFSAEKADYLDAYHRLKNLNTSEIKGLEYLENHQMVKKILQEKLNAVPLEEEFVKQIQKLENGLLMLEQCSPLNRYCIVTNRVIPNNMNTPQFIFINHLGLSSEGLSLLMEARKKYEDSHEGLRNALKDVADLSLLDKIDTISARDIVRLRLYIEEQRYLPPTLNGMTYGFMIGGITSVLFLSLVSMSFPAFLAFAILPSILGVTAGLLFEKNNVKNELRTIIGPMPIFSLASYLYQLLSNDEMKEHQWCAFFSRRTIHTPVIGISVTPSPMSSP